MIKIKRVFLVLCGLLLLTGCGMETKTIENPDGSSMIYKFLAYNKYDGNKYTLKFKNGVLDVTICKDGEKTYYKVADKNEENITIEKDYIRYSLSSVGKTYIQTRIEAYNNYIAGYFPENAELIKNQTYETGEERIGALNYVYEKYIYNGGTTIYYFRGGKLQYIKNTTPTNETTITFVSFSNEVDENVFNIPTEYQEIEL